jgi:hypothetical protein
VFMYSVDFIWRRRAGVDVSFVSISVEDKGISNDKHIIREKFEHSQLLWLFRKSSRVVWVRA